MTIYMNNLRTDSLHFVVVDLAFETTEIVKCKQQRKILNDYSLPTGTPVTTESCFLCVSTPHVGQKCHPGCMEPPQQAQTVVVLLSLFLFAIPCRFATSLPNDGAMIQLH